MNGVRFAGWCAAALALAATSGRAEPADDMRKTVEGFYAAYATFQPSDGIPDTAGRARYEPYVSPALDRLLIEAAAAEDRFAKANKDSPPLIEGDLFTSNFEGATSHRVAACDAATRQCSVALGYGDRAAMPKDRPIAWNDTVYLVATPQGWRIDDIGYGATWAFGNKGRMTETLRTAISEAGR